MKVRHKSNRDILVRYPDARRHMEFPAFDLTPEKYSALALLVVQKFLNHARPKELTTFGYVKGHLTRSSKEQPKVVFALDFIMRNILGFQHVLAVKLGTRISKFPVSKDHTRSMICWGREHFKNHETLEIDPQQSVSTVDVVGPEWPSYNYMQILMSTEEDHDIADIPGELMDEFGPSDRPPEEEIAEAESPTSRLSTIQEGSNEEGSNFLTQLPKQNLPTYLVGYVDEELWQDLDDNAQYFIEEHAAIHYLQDQAPDDYSDKHPYDDNYIPQAPDPSASVDCQIWLGSMTDLLSQPTDVPKQNKEGFGPMIDEHGRQYIAIDFNDANLITPRKVQADESAVLHIFLNSIEERKAVIEKDNDVLTKEEEREHRKEVATAVYEELKTWILHNCFRREQRRGATNILDVKWVLKWKWIPVKDKSGTTRYSRMIRARLTQRGFKDLDKGNLQTFSGTASRLAQKLIVSEVCVRQDQHWDMWTVDVRKAFLKGISYEELAAATGEPLRVVNFELDPESVEILRMFPGFEDFDPTMEVLSNIRPGTGNVDAPRCFGMKLDQAFQPFGAKSCIHDGHVRVRKQSNNNLNRKGKSYI